jgi:hypothetical protein
MAAKRPETESDRRSLKVLHRFLEKAQRFINIVHSFVVSPDSGLSASLRSNITTLWKDADSKLTGAQKKIAIGLSGGGRDDLSSVGFFDEILDAKEMIFDYCVEERRIVSTLKILSSFFGSLSKIFPILSAVKELIDAILAVREAMRDPNFTTLQL